LCGYGMVIQFNCMAVRFRIRKPLESKLFSVFESSFSWKLFTALSC